MNINRKLRFQLLVQNWFFVVLFLMLVVLLGYLANQYHVAKDITQANRNILTQGSVNVLKQMKGPVNITVYATKDDTSSGDNFRKGIVDFVARYQRAKKDIHLTFINPSQEPKLAQDAGVKVDGEVVIEYQKRVEHITPPFAEQEVTNLLVRLSRTNQQAVMYLDGHGERNLLGVRNHDIGEFGKQLEAKGFKFANPDLTIAQAVPSNGAMLVIASPQVDVSDVEAKKIRAYLDAGGNLLWLLDDDNLRGLNEVADYLGLQVSPGIALDMASAQYGADARVAFASLYGEHAITTNFMLRTLFPEAHQVTARGTDENGWKVSNLVEVAPNGWLSAKKLAKDAKPVFDEKNDKRGPINIGVALERTYGKKGQRVVVMGNANFLSNTFITNGGNLDLGVNIINWLAGDDNLITIQPMPLKDINVSIPDTDQGRLVAWIVFHGFQYFIPLGFMIAGFYLWWKRRRA
ncbi:MAG: Gldg family protein [Methylotenera sp.]|nr:Gldg family protein [Methylotenera sp.]MDO9233276.1 Gldg family protein [Methylotenera sp.]MDO9388196.1 Gldg family protein [Methylotenera sp.]MDP2404608.1 Gldg family protein [Methylotenera sp.]MDP3094348.1 Gldg family protein [Methylotenera sp.]